MPTAELITPRSLDTIRMRTLHLGYLEWPKVQILPNHYHTRRAELKAENS